MGTNAKSMESMVVTQVGCLGKLREYRDRSRWDGKKILLVDINVDGAWYGCFFSGNEDERALLKLLEQAVVMKKHVTLGFLLGFAHLTRMLSVSWAKIDGKEVYRAVAGGTGEHLDVEVAREAAGRPENVKRSEWPNWTAILPLLENRRLREIEKACRALGLGSRA